MRGAIATLLIALLLPVVAVIASPALTSYAADSIDEPSDPIAALEVDIASSGETSAVSSGEDLGQLLTPPPAADQTETWWEGLSAETRSDLIRESPEIVGNLDGVPYDVRDRVNREILARTIAEISQSLEDGLGKAASQTAAQRLAMLREIDEALETDPSAPTRRLVVLDTGFPGKAAISLGELSDADFVSILVPGALLSVREHMSEWTKVTADLFESQEGWQSMFDDSRSVATVAWIGYQTPDITNAIGLELAEEGGIAIASFVNGIKTLRPEDEPYISIFAHSYGATATTLALSRGWMSVDALAMMGSPGGEVDSVSDLAVPDEKVWVGEASWDPIVNSAFFGIDPSDPAFGAKRMNVSGVADPMTGDDLTPSYGHDWYLEPGTESLRNLALIGIDRGNLVTDGGADDELKTLPLPN